MPRIVIIGAGQAGLQIAESLRKGAWSGEILLLGDEEAPPYQRPPLSKKFLAGDFAEERLLFRPREHYAKQGIELRTGTRVLAIGRERRTLQLASGESLAYDGLALTTGTRVRPLPVPGSDHPTVCYLRGLDDARRLKARLAGAKHVVVIGGGFIGLEVAATARHAGCEVHVVEAMDRLMARVMPAVLSDFFAGLHRGHGVQLHLDAQVAAIEDGADGAARVRLAGGAVLDADLVVAGIGVLPNQELAAAAGLACGNGIEVDEFARTSDPAIVAAGDCTWHRNRLFDAPHRLESVQNAVDQAKVAAASLLGTAQPYADVPWFWSDQFEVKLQTAGLSTGADAHVLRGEPSTAGFSIFHFTGERLLAVDSVNRPADHMLARRLLAAHTPLTREQAADLTLDLKTLLSAG
jgi:3-phenylpropionate/trans-cinnamate dioxygenase ferredoxin reductase subunit